MIDITRETRKWILVAGARPNFMKIAPLIRAIDNHNNTLSSSLHAISYLLVHTGQHYDVNMSDSFFKDLSLPEPDVHLSVGSGNHGEQTGKVLIEFEKVLLRERPQMVVVVGDVNSTLACALAASKIDYGEARKKKQDSRNKKSGIWHLTSDFCGRRPLIAHVEAGLRSFDRSMPEEINRILTDAISDYLFTPSPDGDENLLKEGIPQEKIFLVGDIMVDSLLFNLEQAKKTDILEQLGLTQNPKSKIQNPKSVRPYALLTLHRPSNVDNKEPLSRILRALAKVSSRIPILFPAHPRTRKQIEAFGLQHHFIDLTNNELPITNNSIYLADPFGYLDFLNLMAHAKIVLTDSGGIQEETTVLNIPCITLRDTTERPITLSEGTNVLVKDDPERIVEEVEKILAGKGRKGTCPKIWDGHTAERIVKILAEKGKDVSTG